MLPFSVVNANRAFAAQCLYAILKWSLVNSSIFIPSFSFFWSNLLKVLTAFFSYTTTIVSVMGAWTSSDSCGVVDATNLSRTLGLSPWWRGLRVTRILSLLNVTNNASITVWLIVGSSSISLSVGYRTLLIIPIATIPIGWIIHSVDSLLDPLVPPWLLENLEYVLDL